MVGFSAVLAGALIGNLMLGGKLEYSIGLVVGAAIASAVNFVWRW